MDLGEKEQAAVVEKKPRMMEGVEAGAQAQVQAQRRVAVVPAKPLPPQDLILKVTPRQHIKYLLQLFNWKVIIRPSCPPG